MLRVLISAGPGGHSGFAYAIGYYLKKLGARVAFVSVGDRWLVEKLSEVGRVIVLPLPRRPGERLLRTLHRWPYSFIKSLFILEKIKYDVFISCGSNFSISPAIVSKLKNIKIYNIEDIVRLVNPSKTAKIIHLFADLTLLQWPEQRRFYPKRSVYVGPIYEPRIIEPSDEGYVFITAGSRGNLELFMTAVKANLGKAVVQTGSVDPSTLKKLRPDWIFIRYTPRIHELIAKASVVVAQFGMTAATAALAYDKPVVLVPARIRTAAGNENMRPYAEKIGAAVVDELSPQSLEEAIENAYRLRLRRPRYPIGAFEAAKLILQDISSQG